ncbi:hypothetical protein SS50377_24140 [Spironucleus salmonicida]|uniref:Uncharacterized protein n=1 Tax=Spironucleus salmonicida TaxID=348837 RepID=V6LXP7_9EUKA|nr:hypothetical protein SS50377_24140 [Spironucleus salmonicida]|eukprot:EST49023.1 Hypothetical protein SS50377_10715 [Spironucleus salmonicida]
MQTLKLESFTQLSLFQNYATPISESIDDFFQQLPRPHYFYTNEPINEVTGIIRQINDVVMMTEEERSKAAAIFSDISLNDCPDDCVGLDVSEQVKLLESRLEILSQKINKVKE